MSLCLRDFSFRLTADILAQRSFRHSKQNLLFRNIILIAFEFLTFLFTLKFSSIKHFCSICCVMHP